MEERRDSVLLGPCSLMSLRASLYLPPPQAARAVCARSVLVVCVYRPELRGIKAVVQCFLCSAESAAAPPTSHFMALLIVLLAVRGHQLFYHAALRPAAVLCSSPCFGCPVCCRPRLLPMRSCISPVSHSCTRRF